MKLTKNYNLNIVEGTDIVNPLVVDNPNYEAIDTAMHNNALNSITTATEIKSGSVHAITRVNKESAVMRFIASSDWSVGDAITVDGVSVTARTTDGEALREGAYRVNADVLAILDGVMLTVYAVSYSKQIEALNSEVADLGGKVNGATASAHNAIFRGKNLGSEVTAEQYASIARGEFNDLYIGDYWIIGGIWYRIAHFDYYYGTGDVSCNVHHVTVVPDTSMYTAKYNDTATIEGAYRGSKLFGSGLSEANEKIRKAFGEGHILSHRQFLPNQVQDGYTVGGGWYDSAVALMTEQNVYGCIVYGNCTHGTNTPNFDTIDKTQYALFAHAPNLIGNRQWYWLRDVAYEGKFCLVGGEGVATTAFADASSGVRPSFNIIG